MKFAPRFRLAGIFYAVAVIASAVGAFGGLGGAMVAAIVIAFWMVVFGTPGRSVAPGLMVGVGICVLVVLLLPARSKVGDAAWRNACHHRM